MCWKETNRKNIKELSKLIKKNTVVPFIGAGMSCPIYPTWKEYLEQLPEDKDNEAKEYIQKELSFVSQNYEEIAQYFSKRYGIEFLDKTKEAFSCEKIKKEKINEAALAIPVLFKGPIITTNLDKTIEWIYRKENISLPVGLANETGFINGKMVMSETCLWKIHGDIDKMDSWILTSKDYNELYDEDSSQFIELFLSVLKYKTLLFLGASLQSDKVVLLLEKLFEKNKNIRHYAILPAPSKSDDFYEEKSRLSNLGVKVIWYPKRDYNAFTQLVNELVMECGKQLAPSFVSDSNVETSGSYTKSEVKIQEIRTEEDMEAQYCLARNYYIGKEVKCDFSKAVYWYQKAAGQGHIQAQCELGWIYENGIGVNKSHVEAKIWYSKAAEQGNPTAQYLLGEIILHNSHGFEKQDLCAEQWLRKAAEQGNVSAHLSLAGLYEKGRGVKQDYNEASRWNQMAERLLLQSAEQRDYDSMYVLGRMYRFGQPGVKQNYEKAIKYYQKAAEQGRTDALYDLGKIYQEGSLKSEPDYNEAIKYLQRAGSQGSISAFLLLGETYEKGLGVEKSDTNAQNCYKKAEKLLLQCVEQGDMSVCTRLAYVYRLEGNSKESIRWCQKAAERGDTSAMHSLARRYLYDEEEKNYKKAMEWYQKAAEQGDISAMYCLGNIYIRGDCVEQNYEMAKKWYRDAAQRGDWLSIKELGKMYEDGLGENSNLKRAVELYEKYAYVGINYARWRLGYIYEKGLGVKQDCGKAVKWYEAAAEHGYCKAQCRLAYMYENGYGVFMDVETAVYWYKIAAKNNMCNDAHYELGRHYFSGVGVKQNYEKAIKWFRKAASGLEGRSILYLGYIYENGYGIEIDYNEAVNWYQKAVNLSVPYAQYLLGLMYEAGRGVPKNNQEAAKLYQKAANSGLTEAQRALAKMYERNGNQEKADEWYRIADEQNVD